MNPSEVEYQNRLNEVLEFDIEKISTVGEAKNYLDRIVSYIDFIENDHHFVGLSKKLSSSRRLEENTAKLVINGELLLERIQELYQSAAQVIQEIEIKLPTQSEVIAAHVNMGVYSPTVEESLGEDIDSIKQTLAQKNHSLDNIEQMVRDLFHTRWDFETLGYTNVYNEKALKELEEASDLFRQMRKENERLASHLGLSDYQVLKGILDWAMNRTSAGSIKFFLTPLGSVIRKKDEYYKGIASEEKKILYGYRSNVESLDHRILEASARKSNVWYMKMFRVLIPLIKWLFNKLTGSSGS